MEQLFDVSEIFYSIQGEGITTGNPAVFIRLANCSLQCGGAGGDLFKAGKATWTCDSESVWRTSTKMTAEQIFNKVSFLVTSKYKGAMTPNQYLSKISIIFTGGEPMLPRNKECVLAVIAQFEAKGIRPYYEVETSGTMPIGEAVLSKINQINCSPKLSNSGMSPAQRIRPEVLKEINEFQGIMVFKFVVSGESDWEEIKRDYLEPYGIAQNTIMLMPACDNLADLPNATKTVWEMGMKYGVSITTRLHILAYDKVVGV